MNLGNSGHFNGFGRKFLLTLLLGAALAVGNPGNNKSLADNAAPATPCDPQYMDALEARAYLQAQREITQNQNLIYKPDSVLEYTCFQQFLNAAGTNWDDRQFSETTRWDTAGFDATTTDLALSKVAGEALSSYIALNFPHAYLGGRAEGAGPYDPSGDVGGTEYTCDVMAQVWDLAKCKNFFDRMDTDAFFDFPYYSGQDPRQYPSGGLFAACAAPASEINGALGIAYNNRQASHTLSPENNFLDGVTYNEDPVTTYLSLILPKGATVGNTTVSCATTPPIPTGVTVTRAGIPPYLDAVCPNPGCSYVAPSGPAAQGGAQTQTPRLGTCQ